MKLELMRMAWFLNTVHVLVKSVNMKKLKQIVLPLSYYNDLTDHEFIFT